MTKKAAKATIPRGRFNDRTILMRFALFAVPADQDVINIVKLKRRFYEQCLESEASAELA